MAGAGYELLEEERVETVGDARDAAHLTDDSELDKKPSKAHLCLLGVQFKAF